jgi:hypothetical protein
MYVHNDSKSKHNKAPKSAARLAAEAAFSAPPVSAAPPAHFVGRARGEAPVVKVMGRKATFQPLESSVSAKVSAKVGERAELKVPDWSDVVAARYGTARVVKSPPPKSSRVFLLPTPTVATTATTAATAVRASDARTMAAQRLQPATPGTAVSSAPRKRRARIQPAPVHVIFSAPASTPLQLTAQQAAQLTQALAGLDAVFAHIRSAAAFEISPVMQADQAAQSVQWAQLSAQVRQLSAELAAFKPVAPSAEAQRREALMTPLQRLFL